MNKRSDYLSPQGRAFRRKSRGDSRVNTLVILCKWVVRQVVLYDIIIRVSARNSESATTEKLSQFRTHWSSRAILRGIGRCLPFFDSLTSTSWISFEASLFRSCGADVSLFLLRPNPRPLRIGATNRRWSDVGDVGGLGDE